jgi:hypothetical protein
MQKLIAYQSLSLQFIVTSPSPLLRSSFSKATR